MPQLKILKGKEAGRSIALGEEAFVGRDAANHVRVHDETASRHHARIQRVDRAWLLVDLGSNNGTFVNGKRVAEQVLAHGDQILVGKTLLAFEASSETQTGGAVTVRDAGTERITVERSLPAGRVELPADRRLQTLYEISAALNSTLDFPSMLDSLAEILRGALDADVVLVETTEAVPPAVRTSGGGRVEVTVSRTALERAKLGRESLLVSGDAGDSGPSVVREKIVSILCAPAVRGEEVLGVIYADSRREEKRFDESDLRFVNAAAHAAALALENARRFGASRVEVSELRREITGRSRLVGNDPQFRRILELVDRAAETDATVLILGESGTGKELVARRLHEVSPRSEGPFVALNCASLVETLLESELFGHERGAFTGADRARPGKFETADRGTIFLDEIAELSASLQGKLLRVLQERTFFRVGGDKARRADVRVVAATNRDLSAAVKEGRFREDLYYRVNVVNVTLPPLRERRGDIPLLVYHFLERLKERTRRSVLSVSPEAMEVLTRHDWPGNVRELENVLERAVLLSDGTTLPPESLPPEVRGAAAAVKASDGWPIRIEEAEKLCLQRALEKTGGKKGEAAKLLGISWPTLNKKIKEYGLE